MEPYWSEANGHAPHTVKYENDTAVSSFPYCTESSLNFSTNATTAYSEDDAEYATGRRNKTSRQDPLSHRIIEKRRRDRMNSCLADLSRLIPPQYQRKGRGRIEKTEIIEMAIRHLKHLQSECMQKENDYRMGYTDCMKEAAKFLYDSQMQEFCYRLLARLQEHCDEIMKNECFRSRACHTADNVSASSGSPHQTFHPVPPLCQLRDMLSNSDIEHSNDHNDVKDLSFRNHLNQLQRNNAAAAAAAAVSQMDSNANDAHANSSISDGPGNGNNLTSNSTASSSVGSVITTNNNAASSTTPSGGANVATGGSSSNAHHHQQQQQQQQPHQAAVITSTAPASMHHLTDSSNHDFDSSREPLLHTDTSNMHSPPPRDTLLIHHHHQHHNQHAAHLGSSHTHHHHHHHHQHSQDSLLQGRLRNFSESSHDIEHNNNYKYKNHIKERFNHELHDEETSSEHCPNAPMMRESENSHAAHSDHSKDGTEPEIAPIIAKKRKLAEAAAAVDGGHHNDNALDAEAVVKMTPSSRTVGVGLLPNAAGREEKPFAPFSDIKTETTSSCSLTHGSSSNKPNLSAPTSTTAPLPARSFAVPIFALHSQGTYYVPLNVDYNVLIPFLNGIDLLEKNFSGMPVVHPININVNFMPSSSASLLAAAAAAVAAGKQQQHPPVINGSSAAAAAVTAAAMARAKLEAITNTNGW